MAAGAIYYLWLDIFMYTFSTFSFFTRSLDPTTSYHRHTTCKYINTCMSMGKSQDILLWNFLVFLSFGIYFILHFYIHFVCNFLLKYFWFPSLMSSPLSSVCAQIFYSFFFSQTIFETQKSINLHNNECCWKQEY